MLRQIIKLHIKSYVYLYNNQRFISKSQKKEYNIRGYKNRKKTYIISEEKLMQHPDYTAKDLKVLEGLEHVRTRPSMYIGSTDSRGLHHLVQEVVDNSIDEAMAGFCTRIDVVLSEDHKSISVNDNGRGIPTDMHPVLKISGVEVALTKLNAGGKFDKKSYHVSGGLHGVGVSVVNALSSRLFVQVKRNNTVYQQEFERGIPKYPLEEVDHYDEDITGTFIEFFPDPKIFGEDYIFDADIISKRLKELAFLNSGLTITFIDKQTEQEERFSYENGLVSFVKELNEGKTVIPENPVYFSAITDANLSMEICFQYNDTYSDQIISFVNNIPTIDGGTHESAFKNAFSKTFNAKAKQIKLIKPEDSLTSEDIKEGLSAVISIKLAEPQFEGQTKGRLGNAEIRAPMENIISEEIERYLDKHISEFKSMVNKAVLAKTAREAARRAKDLVRRKTELDASRLPGKLADCSSQNPEESELFITEGDSAGGCLFGGTEVALADGRNVSFENLVKEDAQGKQNFCYTINNSGHIEIAKISNPRMTRKNASVIKIIIDNDKELICTPDHLFRLTDGSYVTAEELTPQHSLASLYKKLSKKHDKSSLNGYEMVFKAVKNYNHKIKEIIKLDKKVDVYDLEVRDTHNFALAAGIFVHNSAKQGRDRRTQAILPLRGKILNVEKMTIHHALDNDEIKALITSIGTGIKDDFKIEKLRYDKIIIMTDADVDGAHIRTLLLTFFYRYMPDLITSGHIIIAQPPLYAIKTGKENVEYAFSDAELSNRLKDIKGNPEIQRYKGLGEMNPEQLWETTMDKTKRKMLRVTMDDAQEAEETFTLLMGEKVEPRKKFIEDNAEFVDNLDI